MAEAPHPDEFAVPPPDDRSDVDSRNLSGTDSDGDDPVPGLAVGRVVAPGAGRGRRRGVRRGSDEDSEGEDLLENAEDDYRPMPALDAYDDADLDEDVDDPELAPDARAAAERAMARRDVREGRAGRRGARLPGALQDDANEDADDADADRPARRRRIERAQGGGGGDGGAPNPAPTAGTDGLETEDLPDLGVDLDNARGPPREYLAQEPVRRAVASQFRAFLRDFADANGDRVYRGRLRDMCASNGQSLEVSYTHLCTMMPTVAVWVADAPSALLDVLHGAAFEAALSEFPEYGAIHRQVFVRIADLPIHDAIRDLRQYHLGKLVRIAGVATRRTCVYPMLQLVKYDCLKCRYLLGPFVQTDDGGEIKLGSCPQCQSKGPFAVNSAETVYQNFQKITVQEAPGSVPAGRLPRQKDVVLRHDLIDAARPGELIDVTGVYAHAYDVSLNARHGFPVFTTLLEANHVVRREDEAGAGGVRLTDDDRAECERLARDPRIGARVAAAIAPSIYGHSDIKQGLALALFGGQEKTRGTAHRLRGDINVLLLGDPGTAKSQFLKYVEAVAPRAVFATGKGASAVGLTAAVQKDPITREWTLEGGALVLADRGVCLIDEFDKMNEQDRVSIHEAMEQQSISISKAGIVTQLQARCAVIAAANPVDGRYNSTRTFAENVELTEPILSRFDILFVVKDTADPASDGRLAEFVTASHMRAHPDAPGVLAAEPGAVPVPTTIPDLPRQTPDGVDPLTQDQLKKYIAYAKSTCKPKLAAADADKIASVYAHLRAESAVASGMPVAVRHLESIIRMSEAHACMHLRDYVADADVDAALRMMLGSFVATQKLQVQKAMRAKFAKYLTTAAGDRELLLAALQGLAREHARFAAVVGGDDSDGRVRVPLRALEEKAREYGVADLGPLLRSAALADAGFSLEGSHLVQEA